MSVFESSHYDYLEKNFEEILKSLGISERSPSSLIQSHGDKCYGAEEIFKRAGLTFNQGSAIYLLTHVSPYCLEVRETEDGWVDPFEWIVRNKDRFLHLLS